MSDNLPQNQVFLSFLIVCNLLVGSIAITNGQIEWSQPTNFNRIQEGELLKSSYV